jgi:hypothetical protein
MNRINPNDPAYPQYIPGGSVNYGDHGAAWGDTRNPGLSIRAELAARAMQGILANPDLMQGVARGDFAEFDKSARFTIARFALEHADALIAALNREESK